MSDELKQCPFCGHEPNSYRFDYNFPFPGIEYTVECRNSECPVNPSVTRGTEYEATEAWNTRVEHTCILTTEEGNNSWYLCSACYADIYMGYRPTYCPSCGAKVVEE